MGTQREGVDVVGVGIHGEEVGAGAAVHFNVEGFGDGVGSSN